ncbi:SAM-dependent methyltransferase [Xylophilus rhododendri]|uniref:Chemotaxis protein methyltransferase n=1 Tax=Xylophilus rhododendri TaxID=2697032 RepID=A0A857J375_9BURK|nr:protein-glutamate O-methyltransferase CheR [Xylophilus rhododendri]QHI97501.1 SAM-dependent methyltransferase [Xylophilus rhododendri]
MHNVLSDQDFGEVQRFIFDAAGIHLSPAKKALVCGRLARRLQAHKLSRYGEYVAMLRDVRHRAEAQIAVDLLTTNETYFFREPKHFELLRQLAHGAQGGQPFRVWSAACSTGEEPYSIAMVLADCLKGRPFEVVATDISSRVLERARIAHYPEQRTQHIPPDYLRRFCLRGTAEHAGTLLVDRALRQQVRFQQVNLNEALPSLGQFDAIFLRNVMIYFNTETKRQVVARVTALLKPEGRFCIGHSENLHAIAPGLQAVAPSIYRLA